MRNQLLDDFLALLKKYARFRVDQVRHEVPYRRVNRDVGMDAVVDLLTTDGDEIRLVCEILANAQPKQVALAIESLRAYGDTTRHTECVYCLLAETLSSASKALLEEEGVAYYEASGSMHFEHGNAIIHREMPALAKLKTKKSTNLFSGAKEQVVHALLMHWKDTRKYGDLYLSGAELVGLSGTSSFTVSSIMQELEQSEWVVSKGSGPNLRRKLINPGALLDAWEDAWQNRKELSHGFYVYAPGAELMAVVPNRLSKLPDSEQWAITGAVAANQFSPLLTNVDRIKVAVPVGKVFEYAHELEFKPTEKAANIVLVERKASSFQFTQWIGNQCYTSPYIQYLDLLDGQGRNAELADHFRNTVLSLPRQ